MYTTISAPHLPASARLPWLRYRHLAFSVGLALGSLLVCGQAAAAGAVAPTQTPTGGKVVGGAGTITQSGVNTVVRQQSQLLALNWQTFNVGKDASVLFKQPGAGAIALNRILDQNPSQIFGKISSNGQVFLINTHGIIFGAGAQLNVGGLVASTLDLTPPDFLKRHFDLAAQGARAGIVNHGTIAAASGGSVSLIGGKVENTGLIVADYGHISLDGADRAVLNFDGQGLINVEITGALKQRFDADTAAVANNGTLQAQSGTVVLQAAAAKNLFTNLVNNSGVIRAGGISSAGGVVRLVGAGGNVTSSGTIDASGTQGGSVQLVSDQDVGVTGGSINASGTDGGGSIRVGGGWHGGEGLPAAAATYVAPGATLAADATQAGNGGSVVVWGNDSNNFYGHISARGGAAGGNGGQVETSSHYGLNAQGQVDAAAPAGQAGTWLLDPYDVNITTNGAASGADFTATGNGSAINPGAIGNALTGGAHVSIFTGSSGGQNGDITLSDPITAVGGGTLSLQAAGSIFLNAGIASDGKDALNVNLWANYGGAAGGASYASNAACASATACVVDVGHIASAAITTSGGTLDVETGTGGGALNVGSLTNTGHIDTGGGTLVVNATGIAEATAEGNGIAAGGATLDAGAGAINLANPGNAFTGAVSLANSGAGAVTLDNGGHALTLGTLALGSGALTLQDYGASPLTLMGDVATTGAAVDFAGPVVLGDNVVISTIGNGAAGAAVTFGGTVNNAGTTPEALTVNAGTGAVTFAGMVGTPFVPPPPPPPPPPSFPPSDTPPPSDFPPPGTGGPALDMPFASPYAGAAQGPGSVPPMTAAPPVLGANGGTPANPLGSLTVNGGTFSASGALLIANGLSITTGAGPIGQNAAWSVGGPASFAAGAHAITLDNSGNAFAGAVSLANSGRNAVTLDNGGNPLTLGQVQVGSGALTLTDYGATPVVLTQDVTTTGAPVQFAGGATVAGAAVAIDTTDGGAVPVGAGITLGGAVNGSVAGGNSLTLNAGSRGLLTLGGGLGDTVELDNLGLTGLALANAPGVLKANGLLSVSTLDALTTGSAWSGASVALSSGGDLTLGGNVTSNFVGGVVNLVSGGAITQASGVITANTLTGSSVGPTTLAGANAIANLGNFSAAGFTLVDGQGLTVAEGATVDGGTATSLTTTGTASELVIDGTVKGTTTALASSGAIGEGPAGSIVADTLTGSSAAATALNGNNLVANLGSFSANGFAFNDAQALTVAPDATLQGGSSVLLSTTGAGSNIDIDGAVAGATTTLTSAGAINEGAGGSIAAGTLTGSAAQGVQLTGNNAIASLGNFSAAGLALSNGQSLVIAAGATVDGGASTALTTGGDGGDLGINGTLKGANVALSAAGAITEAAGGALQAGTLTGSSVGATSLTGNNAIANLGNFTAGGFSLATGSGLTVLAGATVDGGGATSLATTGSASDLTIDGTLSGTATALAATGAINQGAGGVIRAATLSGQSAGDTTLTGANEVATLGAFAAKDFAFTDAQALGVDGPLATAGGIGNVSVTTTGGTANTLSINQAIHGTDIALASAGDLTLGAGVYGLNIALAANGTLAINAPVVDPATGTVSLVQTGAGGITSGPGGVIVADTLSGSATGPVVLGSATQYMDNRVGVLGDFSAPAGFSLTNGQTLTLASVNGSAYTVDAGTSEVYLGVRNGDLLQSGNGMLYDGTGTFAADGKVGTAGDPIRVTGTGPQTVHHKSADAAYFYAVDSSGDFLPILGDASVNVAASNGAGRLLGVNGQGDRYIDISVITATYRAYGVVPPGVLLPPDQSSCSAEAAAAGTCSEEP